MLRSSAFGQGVFARGRLSLGLFFISVVCLFCFCHIFRVLFSVVFLLLWSDSAVLCVGVLGGF